jgi:hypothetical protein
LKIKYLNKINIILLTLFIAFMPPLSIKAQNRKKKKEDPKAAWTRSRNALEPLPIKLSGIGSTYFYGVKLGVDYPFRMTELRGFKSTATGHRVMREQYLSADVGIWHFDGIHENVFFSTEWTIRFINGQGFFFQVTPIGLGANYLLKPFSPEINIKDSVPSIGKFFGTPSVSIGIGRDLAFRRAQKGVPLTIFLKGGVSAMYPFQKWGYIFPTAEAGLAMRFRGINAMVRKVRRD